MIRDQKTKALLNTDSEALYKYKQEREKNKKIMSMQKDIDYLKMCVNNLYKLLEDKNREK
jgi:hypothetical protein